MPGSIFTEDDGQPENPFAEFDTTDEVVQVQEEVTVYDNVDETPTSEYSEDSLDSEISEAERRFNKAALYKQWVSGRLFGDNDSPEVLEVEKEFKDFARLQLKKLIGIEQEEEKPASSDFTPEQVTVLKTLADQLLKKPTLMKPAESKPQAPKKPQQPVLKPRQAPVKPPTPPAVVPRVAKPVVQQTQPTVTNRVKPSPKPVQASKPTGAVPAHESVIQEKGRTFKVYHIQTTQNEYGPGSAMVIKSMKPNSTLKLPTNGIQIYKDPSGNLFKIIKKDETPQDMPDNRVPVPTGAAMEAATARMSERAAHVAINRDYGHR